MDNKDANTNQFLECLMQNQMRIYAYILSLVRNYHDADDIMQNTVQTMYQKYEESLPIANFVAWGIQIAHFKILDYRKKKVNSHIAYDNHLFEKLVSVAECQIEKSDEKLDKLARCLNRLTPRARKIIELRYYQDLKPRQISSLLGLSILNIYKSISRIHGLLLDCVNGLS